MTEFKAMLMDEAAVNRALKRISHEILERNDGAEDIYIIGIKRRGVPLAETIAANISAIEGVDIAVGVLDIAFYRDDIPEGNLEPIFNNSDIPFDITGKKIILVDDVLYTGRTVRAAMDALMKLGRAASIQLAVLVDRGHRELPIRGDYVGKNIPTSKDEHIAVSLPPFEEEVSVKLYK